MVIRILELLKERKCMSLKELSISLDMHKDAVEDMLEMLIRKGKVKKIDTKTSEAVCPSNKGINCKDCFFVKDKGYFKFYTLAEH
jgi:predicted ArsR family transcriptional regulator